MSTSPTIPLPGLKPPPEPFSRMVARWVTRATFLGVGISCVAHLMFLAIAYAVPLHGPAQAGNSEHGGEGVQMAVMSAEAFGALAESDIDTSTPAIAEMPPSQLPGIDLKD